MNRFQFYLFIYLLYKSMFIYQTQDTRLAYYKLYMINDGYLISHFSWERKTKTVKSSPECLTHCLNYRENKACSAVNFCPLKFEENCELILEDAISDYVDNVNSGQGQCALYVMENKRLGNKESKEKILVNSTWLKSSTPSSAATSYSSLHEKIKYNFLAEMVEILSSQISEKPVNKQCTGCKEKQQTIELPVPLWILRSISGHWYFLSSIQMTFTDAMANCSSMDSYLIEVDDFEEHTFITMMMTELHYWVGLDFDVDTEQWRWINSNGPVDSNIPWNQQTNPGDYAVRYQLFQDGYKFDGRINPAEFHYICEKDGD